MEIPLRPSTYKKSQLTDNDKNCLSYYVLFKSTKGDAYLKFVDAKFVGSTLMLNKLSEGLFGTKDAKDYIEDYKQTLLEFMDATKAKPKNDEERRAANELRIKAMEEKVFQIVEDNLNNPAEALEAAKMYFKELRAKDEDVAEEAVRRYLPEQCSPCRYKIYCEQECIDECTICKYKKYANENGINYDHKTQLEKQI